MADLDFVKVVGRLGLTVADDMSSMTENVDADEDPDIYWCTEGEVWFTPLNSVTKLLYASAGPATLGHAVIKAIINDQGYLTWRDRLSVTLVDLTSSKVNPAIGPGLATHRVEFKNIRAGFTPVTLSSFTARFSADTVGQNGTCDITLMSPSPVAGGVPIVVGPQGVSVNSLKIVDGELHYVLSDLTEASAGVLPQSGNVNFDIDPDGVLVLITKEG